MKTKEIIKIGMAKNDIDGVLALAAFTGISYHICNRALKNDGSIKLKDLVLILGQLGYELKAEIK